MAKQSAEEKARRRAKKSLKKFWKSLHNTTKVFTVLCLLVGLAVGALASLLMSANDRFLLKGASSYSLQVGTAYTYTEEGFEAISFGRDVAGKVEVETDLQRDADGNYIIPTDKAGVYTITYTVDTLKFGEKAPNGAVKRIRVFTVEEIEEDGRYGEE